MSSIALLRVVAMAALLTLLSGCSGSSLLDSGKPAAGIEQPFELQGRVYVRYGARAFSGSIRWQHASASDQVWLGAPLGQTAAHIQRDDQGAILTTADQREYRSMSLERLTKDGLGWTLPLADLSYYVLGEVPPGVADSSIERDADRRASRVLRDGWDVAFVRAESPSSAPYPARLTLRKDEVEIRLVIDRLESGAG